MTSQVLPFDSGAIVLMCVFSTRNTPLMLSFPLSESKAEINAVRLPVKCSLVAASKGHKRLAQAVAEGNQWITGIIYDTYDAVPCDLLLILASQPRSYSSSSDADTWVGYHPLSD